MRQGLVVLILAGAFVGGLRDQSDRALADQRTKIDALDTRIVALLNERAEVVREVGRIKKQSGLPVNDQTRVEDVLRRIAAANRGPLPNEHLRKIYETIVREMTAFEAADMARR
jgi:chorismate mutase / prephenate dehydratase